MPTFSPGWCHEPGLKALLYKSTLRKFSTYLASCPRRRQAARVLRRRPLLIAVAPRPCLDESPPGARRRRPAPPLVRPAPLPCFFIYYMLVYIVYIASLCILCIYVSIYIVYIASFQIFFHIYVCILYFAFL